MWRLSQQQKILKAALYLRVSSAILGVLGLVAGLVVASLGLCGFITLVRDGPMAQVLFSNGYLGLLGALGMASIPLVYGVSIMCGGIFVSSLGYLVSGIAKHFARYAARD